MLVCIDINVVIGPNQQSERKYTMRQLQIEMMRSFGTEIDSLRYQTKSKVTYYISCSKIRSTLSITLVRQNTAAGYHPHIIKKWLHELWSFILVRYDVVSRKTTQLNRHAFSVCWPDIWTVYLYLQSFKPQTHLLSCCLIYIIKIGRSVCGQLCDWSTRSAGQYAWAGPRACAGRAREQRGPVIQAFLACNI